MDYISPFKNNFTQPRAAEKRHDIFVSDDLLQIFSLINYAILAEIISVFGIIFNVINFIVFVKMGFNDSVNIPLLGLTIADILSLLPMFWMGLCYNPLIVRTYSELDFQGIQHLTAGWPHVFSTRITSLLTAFITLERYLCVAMPLKVKYLFTPRKTAITVVILFGIIIAGVIPAFCSSSLDQVYSTRSNRTVIGLVYYPNGHITENGSVFFAGFTQLITFASVIVTTVGLVTKYKETSKWRQRASSASVTPSMSKRDKKTVKMIIAISVIFIVSYIPGTINIVAMFSYQEFNINGLFHNLFIAGGTFYFCLESVNSSVNIFVYLKMSSKYRKTFMQMFKLTNIDGKM